MEHNSFYLEKTEPVPGSVHASIYSPRISFHSPTWGFQKHNSYRVATPHNTFVMLYNTDYADNLLLIYSPRSSFHSPMWRFQRHNSYRVATPYSTFMKQYSTNCKTIFRLFIPTLANEVSLRGAIKGTIRTELRCCTAHL